jgi:hypothetical protein
MVLNLFLMLAVIAMLGFFMERKLQKGVKAHESVSGRKGGNEREGSGELRENAVSSIIKMLGRR